MACERLSAEEAAARLLPSDTLGLPLGPGQPPAFLAALGERDDWEDLRVYGALLSVGTELFSRDGVDYLSASSARSSAPSATRARRSASPRRTSAASHRSTSSSDPG